MSRLSESAPDEFVDRGHDVTVSASGDSTTSATLVAPVSRALRCDPAATDRSSRTHRVTPVDRQATPYLGVGGREPSPARVVLPSVRHTGKAGSLNLLVFPGTRIACWRLGALHSGRRTGRGRGQFDRSFQEERRPRGISGARKAARPPPQCSAILVCTARGEVSITKADEPGSRVVRARVRGRSLWADTATERVTLLVNGRMRPRRRRESWRAASSGPTAQRTSRAPPQRDAARRAAAPDRFENHLMLGPIRVGLGTMTALNAATSGRG
jgi:hypothetical protein